jgi:hypothetical protein
MWRPKSARFSCVVRRGNSDIRGKCRGLLCERRDAGGRSSVSGWIGSAGVGEVSREGLS